MISSLRLVRNILNYSQNASGVKNVINRPIIRNSHVVSYRTAPTNSKFLTVASEAVGAAMWWWIIWHLWHESEHITGEFPYPSTSSWTNRELGIPASKE